MKIIPPKLLFCAPHWRLTPPAIRRRVWLEYRPGQENRKDPTKAYLVVMKEAIEAVAEKEGRR